MSSIKIIAVPPGSLAPYSIRKQWVGLQIPLVTDEQLRQNPLSGFRQGNQNSGGYLVLRSEAIAALEAAGHLFEAGYWEGVTAGAYLQFKKDVCELVE